METKPGSNIIFEDEFLFIELTGKKPKTDIYTIFSKCSDCELGEIRWHPSWRHYCFFQLLKKKQFIQIDVY